MPDLRAVYFEFDPKLNQLGKKKELRYGLSVSVQVGSTLWLANDETISLERLGFQDEDLQGNYRYAAHRQFLLSDYLSLPAPPGHGDHGKVEEADIEGLDYQDGYLWLIGSHSLKRKKPDPKDSDAENLECLGQLSSEGNRYLLARIPVLEEGGDFSLQSSVVEHGKKRVAARLEGGIHGNELMDALRKDPHLSPFLSLPGKDNGLDIEGLAVSGHRIFVGLRGPVLRGWAVILELQLKEGLEKDRVVLKLTQFKKYFLQLGGLGIRDLLVQGNDLLILAGPTMDLDGPVTVVRWPGGATGSDQSFVYREALEKILDIPYGLGDDHAEGMALITPPGGQEPNALLVVYDMASESRMSGSSGMRADLFPFG